jgi:hypothetical protein
MPRRPMGCGGRPDGIGVEFFVFPEGTPVEPSKTFVFPEGTRRGQGDACDPLTGHLVFATRPCHSLDDRCTQTAHNYFFICQLSLTNS